MQAKRSKTALQHRSILHRCRDNLAAAVGGGFPLLFARIGVDPAIAAGPVVTTSVDLLGITAFLLIARAFLV